MALKCKARLMFVLVTAALSAPPLSAIESNTFAGKIEKTTKVVALSRDKKQHQCKKAHSKLRKIRSRMRSGYTARQYNGLIKKERRYKADITKYCNN